MSAQPVIPPNRLTTPERLTPRHRVQFLPLGEPDLGQHTAFGGTHFHSMRPTSSGSYTTESGSRRVQFLRQGGLARSEPAVQPDDRRLKLAGQ